jgi:hypothetical protein
MKGSLQPVPLCGGQLAQGFKVPDLKQGDGFNLHGTFAASSGMTM